MSPEFDESVFCDEEFVDEDFEEIDALIEFINTFPRPTVSVLNKVRVQQMRFTAAMIKRLLRETGSEASIDCRQHEHNPNVGVVRVEGIDLALTDMEGYARAAEFASNTEIYPLKNDKVRMTFTFHGLVIPLDYESQ
jgi:hypothetical protein